MHMICEEDFEIKSKVLKALEKCSAYYMEVDLGSASELGLMEDNQLNQGNLTDGLSEKQTKELEEILASQFQLTLDEANELPPAALAGQIAADAMGCDQFKIAEMELLMIAHNMGLKTGGIETAQEQMDIAKKVFGGRELLSQLKSASSYKRLFAAMVKSYRNENLKELANLVTDKRFMTKGAYQILVKNRNKKWSKRIPPLIQQQSTFIAMGAGHLPGEEGVIHLLREQDFSVNPVYR